MTEPVNALKVVFAEVEALLEPLVQAGRGPRQRALLFAQLGWDVDAITGLPVQDLDQALNAVPPLIDAVKDGLVATDFDFSKIADLLKASGDAIGSIDRIEASLRSGLPWIPAGVLAVDLLNFLALRYLSDRFPRIYAALALATLIDLPEPPAVDSQVKDLTSGRLVYDGHRRLVLRLDRLPRLVTDPVGLFHDIYWPRGFVDTTAAHESADRFLPRVAALIQSFGGDATYGIETGPDLDYGAVNNAVLDHMLTFRQPLPPDISDTGDTLSSSALAVTAGFVAPDAADPYAGVVLVPSGSVTIRTTAGTFLFELDVAATTDGLLITEAGVFAETQDAEVDATLTVTKLAGESGAGVLIGSRDGTHFAVGSIRMQAGGAFTASGINASLGFELLDTELVIKAGDGDGFLQKVLPADGLRIEFDFGLGWSNTKGWYFHGGAGLEAEQALCVDLGILQLNSIFMSLRVKAEDGHSGIKAALAVTVTLKLGPLTATVERLGLKSDLNFPPTGGNLGPAQLGIGFKPPNGVGLVVDAGAVKGSGYLYFDFEKEEYAGVLELSLAGFVTLTAIGLITTQLPGALGQTHQGFSLLIIITAEFGTGIQLGFGFTLLGVGGLLGLNRTVKLQPLADGVRTGAVNNIMFPKNVGANAPRIISDLRAIFPPFEGTFLIGPMAKLGWGSPPLITLSLGIIIEIPGNLAILGVLRCILPDEKTPVLVLQVAFIGAIEFDKKRLWLFAGIFDSKILMFTIEGEMGVLFAWGADANFVLSVGGFHPRFTPPPLPFPSPKRLTICILDEDWARIRVSTYFAVTTNTVQFGARAELFLDLDAISVAGHFEFDALFQFSPFYFVIELSASVSLSVFGIGVFSISLELALEGPTPWRAHGRGSIRIFFFEVSANFDVTWGKEEDTTLPPIQVLPLLEKELDKETNWSVLPPKSGNLLVLLRVGKIKEFILHPVGTLRITQRLVPLNSKIDLLGAQKPVDANRFALAVKTPGLVAKKEMVREEFAPAQFHALSRAEKLAAPAFSKEDGGVDISASGNALRSSLVARRIVRYEQIIIDTHFKRVHERFVNFTGSLFRHFLIGNAAARASLSDRRKNLMQPFQETIRIRPEEFAVVYTTNNTMVAGTAVFGSYHAAKEHLEQSIAQDPGLAGTMHVVRAFETRRAA